MQYDLFAGEKCCLKFKVECAAKVCGHTVSCKDPKDMMCEGLTFRRWPAMQGAQCGTITGSNAVLRYIANTNAAHELYGQSINERAEVDAILDACAAELETPVIAGKKGQNVEQAKKDIAEACEQVNKTLSSKTFLVGERMTIADLAIVGALKSAHELKLVDLSAYVHASRLVNTVVGHVGDKFAVSAKAKPTECPKPVVAAKPAEAKPVEAAKPAEAEVEAPKAKDPMDLLPPTSFNIEEWKRVYSQACFTGKAEDMQAAMQWFWENMDKEGWSFWHCKYVRYDESDNAMALHASNLMGMHLQRMDNALRRYMFGVYNAFNMNTFFDVEGVLLIRGQEIPEKLKVHDQFDSFVFTKLNMDDAKDKKCVVDFFTEWDQIEGKAIEASKTYK